MTVQMSEDLRRRVRRTVRTQRVGEPNVLSDAAPPNTLSSMGERPASTQVGTGGGPRVGTREGTAGWLATGTAAATPRGRVPSIGTVIFLGFLAITGFRLFGEFVGGLATETPVVSTPASPDQAVPPGTIAFGPNSDGNCGVVRSASSFPAGADVWWTASLSTKQAPDAEVVVIVRRDGAEVEREAVPPDPSIGAWSVLCSGKSINESSPGLYRVEVWDSAITTLHAVGEYTLVKS